jgi:hypothetical protein
MKPLISVLVGLLLLTGCGSEAKKELKYDELDLRQYQVCLDYTMSSFSKRGYTYSEMVTDLTIKACKKYLPVKK